MTGQGELAVAQFLTRWEREANPSPGRRETGDAKACGAPVRLAERKAERSGLASGAAAPNHGAEREHSGERDAGRGLRHGGDIVDGDRREESVLSG